MVTLAGGVHARRCKPETRAGALEITPVSAPNAARLFHERWELSCTSTLPHAHEMLRPVLPTDLEVFFGHQTDVDALRMAAMPMRDHEAFMKHWRERVLADERSCVRTITAGGNVVGYIVSYDLNGVRLLGYWLGREHWGRGLATAALKEFLTEDLHRPLRAHVVAHNLASIRVLEKCGLRRVGEPTSAEDGVVELLYELGA
jgi:RimJ/RimL family protein N-acetyltransferase